MEFAFIGGKGKEGRLVGALRRLKEKENVASTFTNSQICSGLFNSGKGQNSAPFNRII